MKHFLYVTVIMTIWLVILLNNITALYRFSSYVTVDHNFYGETSGKVLAAYICMFGNGMALSVIRLIDPYYKHILKKQLAEYFGVLDDSSEEGLPAKPLSSYLAESLNLELINIILQGISKFSYPDYNQIVKIDDQRRFTAIQQSHDESHGKNIHRVRRLDLDRI